MHVCLVFTTRFDMLSVFIVTGWMYLALRNSFIVIQAKLHVTGLYHQIIASYQLSEKTVAMLGHRKCNHTLQEKVIIHYQISSNTTWRLVTPNGTKTALIHHDRF